jgi:hypothetical protein
MQESITPFVLWQYIYTKSKSKEVQMITIVGILRASAEAVPVGCSLKIGSILDIPLYNGDIEKAEGIPSVVEDLEKPDCLCRWTADGDTREQQLDARCFQERHQSKTGTSESHQFL